MSCYTSSTLVAKHQVTGPGEANATAAAYSHGGGGYDIICIAPLPAIGSPVAAFSPQYAAPATATGGTTGVLGGDSGCTAGGGEVHAVQQYMAPACCYSFVPTPAAAASVALPEVIPGCCMKFFECGCYSCYPAVIPGCPTTPASLAAATAGAASGGMAYPAMVLPCWVAGPSPQAPLTHYLSPSPPAPLTFPCQHVASAGPGSPYAMGVMLPTHGAFV
jgi:hypothetical protein